MEKYTLICKPDDPCIGCKNIANAEFPFRCAYTDRTEEGLVSIDTEGCGKTQDYSKDGLIIFYCPVCGRYIYKEGEIISEQYIIEVETLYP